MKRLRCLGVWAAFGLACAAHADASLDPALFAYHERPGIRLPAQSLFRDSEDRSVRLGALSHGTPLILVLAYFRCANLCGIVRASLFRALSTTGLQAGRDYEVAVLSIDSTETSADARAAKTQDAAFGIAGADRYTHYLTGSSAEVRALADAVGFHDQLDPRTRQFIHPAGIIFATPAGIVSSYLLGVGYTPVAVRSAVERASVGSIAAAGSPLLLICFHFDPTTGRYSLEIMKVFRLAGILTVLTLAALLYLLFRREGRRS